MPMIVHSCRISFALSGEETTTIIDIASEMYEWRTEHNFVTERFF